MYVPPEWLKEHKVSEGQRQWWEFKSRHWDAVLLFKMGKFYELFEMDAHVGAEVCGLSYMKASLSPPGCCTFRVMLRGTGVGGGVWGGGG